MKALTIGFIAFLFGTGVLGLWCYGYLPKAIETVKKYSKPYLIVSGIGIHLYWLYLIVTNI
jgi:hypothetical protein